MPPYDDDLVARIRDHLYASGPALPHDIAHVLDVPLSAVMNLLRDGVLVELRAPEPVVCETCDAAGVVTRLCPACRSRLTPPTDDEERPERPSPEPVARPAQPVQRFHTRRLGEPTRY